MPARKPRKRGLGHSGAQSSAKAELAPTTDVLSKLDEETRKFLEEDEKVAEASKRRVEALKRRSAERPAKG